MPSWCSLGGGLNRQASSPPPRWRCSWGATRARHSVSRMGCLEIPPRAGPRRPVVADARRRLTDAGHPGARIQLRSGSRSLGGRSYWGRVWIGEGVGIPLALVRLVRSRRPGAGVGVCLARLRHLEEPPRPAGERSRRREFGAALAWVRALWVRVGYQPGAPQDARSGPRTAGAWVTWVSGASNRNWPRDLGLGPAADYGRPTV